MEIANTEWKSTKDPSKNNPKYIELRDIFKHSHSYKLREKALKNFDKYDCIQSRDYLKHIAQSDPCFTVRFRAYNLLKHSFGMKDLKFTKVESIYKFSEYQTIHRYIGKICRSLGITSADQFDDAETRRTFYKIFNEKYPREWDLISGKFLERDKKLGFIKKEYLSLFPMKKNRK